MMKKILVLVILLLAAGCTSGPRPAEDTTLKREVDIMKIESQDLGELVPEKFTCDGEDISPSLSWSDAPDQTKSFAILVHDPDAPSGDWVHWIVYDIPEDINSISQGEVPGEQAKNDFGKKEYGGPCPPSGTHRYFFVVYALDAENLEISDKDDFFKKMEEHALAKAELVSRYSR